MNINLNPPSIVVGLIAGLAIAASMASAESPGQQIGRYQLTVSEGKSFTRAFVTDTETGEVRESDELADSSSYVNPSVDELFAARDK